MFILLSTFLYFCLTSCSFQITFSSFLSYSLFRLFLHYLRNCFFFFFVLMFPLLNLFCLSLCRSLSLSLAPYIIVSFPPIPISNASCLRSLANGDAASQASIIYSPLVFYYQSELEGIVVDWKTLICCQTPVLILSHSYARIQVYKWWGPHRDFSVKEEYSHVVKCLSLRIFIDFMHKIIDIQAFEQMAKKVVHLPSERNRRENHNNNNK